MRDLAPVFQYLQQDREKRNMDDGSYNHFNPASNKKKSISDFPGSNDVYVICSRYNATITEQYCNFYKYHHRQVCQKCEGGKPTSSTPQPKADLTKPVVPLEANPSYVLASEPTPKRGRPIRPRQEPISIVERVANVEDEFVFSRLTNIEEKVEPVKKEDPPVHAPIGKETSEVIEEPIVADEVPESAEETPPDDEIQEASETIKESPTNVLFGQALKRIRQHKQMTAVGLAQALGMALSTIFGWEAGRKNPPDDTKQKLSEILGFNFLDFTEEDLELKIDITGLNLNQALRILRKHHNMSIQDLAELCEVQPSTAGRWERGECLPPKETICYLSKCWDANLETCYIPAPKRDFGSRSRAVQLRKELSSDSYSLVDFLRENPTLDFNPLGIEKETTVMLELCQTYKASNKSRREHILNMCRSLLALTRNLSET